MDEDSSAFSFYSLSFDVSTWGDRLIELNNFFDDEDDIDGWWNYIPGLYIFKSSPRNFELLRSIRTFMGRRMCVMFELGKPDEIVGYLPAEAWGWFYGHDDELVKQIKKAHEEKVALRQLKGSRLEHGS